MASLGVYYSQEVSQEGATQAGSSHRGGVGTGPTIKSKGDIYTMAINYTINRAWFDEIKDRVPHENPCTYKNPVWGTEMVEVDILDKQQFIKVSRELGWME